MQSFIDKFTSFYGSAPTAAAMAPGRLEILGNHTDYNQGFVLSCAVEQNTAFALRRKSGTVCTLRDFRSGSTMEFDLADLDAVPKNGSRYVKGMVKELAKRGFEVTAFDAAIESSVPLSAGMSSSAALETAAGLALGKAFNFELSRAEWARAGQGVENNFLGLKSGLLDQFSSLFGKKDAIIMSDFRTVEVVDTLPLRPGYLFVVINSMKKHHLVDSDYNVRRENCESAARKLAAIYPGVKTLRDVTPEMLENAAEKLSFLELSRARHVV
ncbi:MAG: galactokinase, partial [Lentisphaeria bacterium]|nr:galactokinase [Lentisphaeria bacterium]